MTSISLASAAEKQKKLLRKKKFGLTTTAAAAATNNNVFGNDNDVDVDNNADSDDSHVKNPVNRDLLREQAALRQRAAAALHYDFDGTYQETAASASAAADEPPKKKESRYIADMMKKAKQRNFERDIANERKIAREQEAEGAEGGEDKEQFITSAYKKKLRERALWKEEQAEEEQRDAQQDVTKRGDLAGFYGNFSRNVAVGGEDAPKEKPSSFLLDGFEVAGSSEKNTEGVERGDNNNRPAFLDGFAASTNASESMTDGKRSLDETNEDAMPKKSMREIRQEKVQAARLRYFTRRGITEQQALQETY